MIDWPLQLAQPLNRISDLVLEQIGNRPIVAVMVPPEPGNAAQRLRHLLDGLDINEIQPAGIVYASSTAMYGDHGGRIVNEDSPCLSQSPRALARLDDESLLADWAQRRKDRFAVSLRLAGIYGPGRLPIERLSDRGALLCPGVASPGNRVHVDDIVDAFLTVAQVIEAHDIENRDTYNRAHYDRITPYHVEDARERSDKPAIGGGALARFNVAARDHASYTQFVWWLADALRRPRPPCTANTERWSRDHPGLAAFLRDSKQIDSRRLRALGWQPRFDDTPQGIQASLAENQ
ncbi:MAG: NAD-dependent epimerase/dehydratase family protein [Thioalkalivibrionaceae bacterium]